MKKMASDVWHPKTNPMFFNSIDKININDKKSFSPNKNNNINNKNNKLLENNFVKSIDKKIWLSPSLKNQSSKINENSKSQKLLNVLSSVLITPIHKKSLNKNGNEIININNAINETNKNNKRSKSKQIKINEIIYETTEENIIKHSNNNINIENNNNNNSEIKKINKIEININNDKIEINDLDNCLVIINDIKNDDITFINHLKIFETFLDLHNIIETNNKNQIISNSLKYFSILI